MTLPYPWHPLGIERVDRPSVGDVLPFEHGAWRVLDVTDRHVAGRDGLYTVAIVRPVATPADSMDRSTDRHIGWPKHHRWEVFTDPDHFPVCSTCREPVPCRDQMAARVADEAARDARRYETAGVCPACLEPVTNRQRSLTLEENLRAPAGPPVTFHLRRRCLWNAIQYEKAWAAARPDDRVTTLSCVGTATWHGDRTYECTVPACPGPAAEHRGWRVCAVAGCTDEACQSGAGDAWVPRASVTRRPVPAAQDPAPPA